MKKKLGGDSHIERLGRPSSETLNRQFPSSPLFQSESKCETILIKISLICMKMNLQGELIFHMKGFSLRLVLKQRHKRTRKWPIEPLKEINPGVA